MFMSAWGAQASLKRDPLQRRNCPLMEGSVRGRMWWISDCLYYLRELQTGSTQGSEWCSPPSSRCWQMGSDPHSQPLRERIGSASWCLRKQKEEKIRLLNLTSNTKAGIGHPSFSRHHTIHSGWPVPPFLPKFTSVEIWSLPVSVCVCVCVCVEGNSCLGCSKENLLTFFSRVLLGAYSIWCLLSERSTVMVTASLSKSSMFDQSEGHIYEVRVWKWKWDQFGFITCGINLVIL